MTKYKVTLEIEIEASSEKEAFEEAYSEIERDCAENSMVLKIGNKFYEYDEFGYFKQV